MLCFRQNKNSVTNPIFTSNSPLPDRAAIKFHITAAPISNRCISSAYAPNDFDCTITLCEREPLYLSDTRQIQWTVIDSPDTETFFDDCGRQYSALGGRGITVTALPILSRTTAPIIKMDFDNKLFNTMELLLLIYYTYCCENGFCI